MFKSLVKNGQMSFLDPKSAHSGAILWLLKKPMTKSVCSLCGALLTVCELMDVQD